MVERLLDKQDVTGSSPVTPIVEPLDFGLGALFCRGIILPKHHKLEHSASENRLVDPSSLRDTGDWFAAL